MAEWSVMDRDWPFNQFDPYQLPRNQYNPENPEAPPPCMPPPPVPPPPPLPVLHPPPPAQAYLPGPSTSHAALGPPTSHAALGPPTSHAALGPPTSYPALGPPTSHAALGPSTSLAALLYQEPSTSRGLSYAIPQPPAPPPRGNNPRQLRNQLEKERRDKLNKSIGELASMVPPVVAATRKIDKTGVLRLTAHFLRAHQYVFGDSIQAETENHRERFSATSTRALLAMLNGFLLTTTYRGLIVVVSQNVQQYLGYTELDLLGQNVFTIIHEDDRQLMRDQLMPKSYLIGQNGELLVPDEPDGKQQVAEILANEKRRFMIRFKKLGQRSEPSQYVTCHIEGTLRKSDRAIGGHSRRCQMVRRARARGDNPCNSGNDVVFVGVVRLATETFITESNMESYYMEYRTRHSIDGQIIQTEQRISLVTGYMTHEVNGINAMNFMHRDDVRWVVIALREMYDQHRLVGESCYRLMAKNGEFIYLKTRGRLEVDPNTRAVTSFVCMNTVVGEQEGKHLIKQMKTKFRLMVNNNEEPLQEIEETKEANDQSLAVEDPRQLEKVILHLVTNLPSPQSEDDYNGESPDRNIPASSRLAIIPPKKERIVSAIEKIYSVIKTFPQESGKPHLEETTDTAMAYKRQSTGQNPQLNNDKNRQPVYNNPADNPLVKLPNFSDVYQRRHTETSVTLQELNTFNAANAMRNPRAVATVTRPMSESPSSGYSGLATITSLPMTLMASSPNIPTAIENATATVKYHLYVTPMATPVPLEPGNNDLSLALPGSSAGTKRPREYTDLDVATKKKTTETAVKPPEKQDENDTCLDASFIDEALTSYPHIESAINRLEQAIDPSFPDLLISQEVEDILHQIEKSPSNNKAEN